MGEERGERKGKRRMERGERKGGKVREKVQKGGMVRRKGVLKMFDKMKTHLLV